MTTSQHPKKGNLILAEPFMSDPNFKRTVILLCEHNKEGSFGLVVNRKIDLLLSDVIANVGFAEIPLYYGGPVEQDTLHFIHTYGELIEGSTKIGPSLYWGGDFEQIKQYLSMKLISLERIRFYIGYVGWSTGQLNQECEEQSWITTPNQEKYIFSAEPKKVWPDILRNMGGSYQIMANFPENPSLN